ncbi:DUF2577 domain-containing protein [Anaerophilus nitritogenes]|uniref:DUF2577 domain-containing protein n=1 Tax=Anaerophilus nitritogenes TaxID=2498136 RepID=UPI00101D7FC9|nr:DUF2577 domain-containing protein [Anaerophilus nitritogenes]
MVTNDGITELAKMFKDRENPKQQGIQVGTVISPPPATKIRLTDKIILENDDLVFSAHVLNGYVREYTEQGNIQFTQSNCGNTNTVATHNHSVANININTSYTTIGNITFTDTLKVGDEVTLMPSVDEQTWFVIDKAIRL